MEIYNLTSEVFSYYQRDTKRGKNCTKECVERKLSALMMCAAEVKDLGMNSKIFKFGTFNIIARGDCNDIGLVYWTNEHPVHITKEQSQMLHTMYVLLGLSEDGQNIVGDIDEIALDKFIEDNNLSYGKFKTSFLDLPEL